MGTLFVRWGAALALVFLGGGVVSWKLPGGGFHSCVGDMGRFGVGLLGKKLLSEEGRTLMFSVRQPETGKTGYALGIGVRREGETITRLSHSGAQARTRTLLVLDPVHNRGFAIMTNSEWGKCAAVWRAARKSLGW